jgi:hypothetical protein
MKNHFIFVMTFVTACAGALAQQQNRPTSQSDPTNSCLAQSENSPALAILKPKVGKLFGRADPTIEMRANRDKPTDEEKQALSAWGKVRQQCLEMGRAYRAQYAPPGWVAAVEDGQSQLWQAIASLYVGDITFGQFVAERDRIGIAAVAGMEQADRADMATRAQQAQQRAKDAQQSEARANAAIQMLLQPPPQAVRPMQTPSVNCTSRAVGNTVQTNCN